jgi:FKBP-type peptidyl-prolyl cis-trans isomerase
LFVDTLDLDKPMRPRSGSVVFLVVFAFGTIGCGGGTPSLDTQDLKASYALGYQTGNQLKPAAPHVDLEAFQAGIRDALAEIEPVIPRPELQEALQTLSETVNQELAEEQAAVATQNQEEGAAFYEENLAKEGVVTTESGLQYEVIEEGDGPTPSADDRVSIHYRGTLLDGTEFDSSYDRGEPTEFGVTAVIAGFSEGLQLMKVGSHYRFFIQSSLAYGAQGSPPTIGPNATLIFEVEMLEIVE